MLPAKVHVQGMDIGAAELPVAAGVVHMAVGVDHIQGQLCDGSHQGFQIAVAVARVEQQRMVTAHDQVHEDRAVADAKNARLQLSQGVDVFQMCHGIILSFYYNIT